MLHDEPQRGANGGRDECSIGELAREFDVTPRAIRFYEAEGLLAPRRDGQRRIYTARDRTRLKLTLRGKRLGLTLGEIRELIDMYDAGRDERPQLERFLAILAQHRDALEQQREDIEAQLSEINVFEKRCRQRLAEKKQARAPRRRGGS
jgi:DNA-binding transcriptional MerR regulator